MSGVRGLLPAIPTYLLLERTVPLSKDSASAESQDTNIASSLASNAMKESSDCRRWSSPDTSTCRKALVDSGKALVAGVEDVVGSVLDCDAVKLVVEGGVEGELNELLLVASAVVAGIGPNICEENALDMDDDIAALDCRKLLELNPVLRTVVDDCS